MKNVTVHRRPVAWCARFDEEEADIISRLADDRYEGNRSMALRWLVRMAGRTVVEGT